MGILKRNAEQELSRRAITEVPREMVRSHPLPELTRMEAVKGTDPIVADRLREVTENWFDRIVARHLDGTDAVYGYERAAPESSIARYARHWDCAELAEEPSVEAVGAALRRVACPPERQRRLVERGLQAFAVNHDIHRQRADLVCLLRRLTSGQGATA